LTKNPRRTKPEEGALTAPRRIRSPRTDGLTIKERYQDMKINFLKTIHLLREEAIPLTDSDSVTKEYKEDKTEKQASSSVTPKF
jgi:hypothetical protein